MAGVLACAATPATRVLPEDALLAQDGLELAEQEGLQEATEALRRRPRHNRHRAPGMALADPLRELLTGHARHHEVRDDEVRPRSITDSQCLSARRAGLDTRIRQKVQAGHDDDPTGTGVVVNDQQKLHLSLPRPDVTSGLNTAPLAMSLT